MKKRLYLYFHRRTHSVLLARVLGEAERVLTSSSEATPGPLGRRAGALEIGATAS